MCATPAQMRMEIARKCRRARIVAAFTRKRERTARTPAPIARIGLFERSLCGFRRCSNRNERPLYSFRRYSPLFERPRPHSGDALTSSGAPSIPTNKASSPRELALPLYFFLLKNKIVEVFCWNFVVSFLFCHIEDDA